MRASSKGAAFGSPPDSDFVFLSHSADKAAAEDVEALRTRIDTRLDALGVTGANARAGWRERLHFATTRADAVAAIAPILDAWPTTTDEIAIELVANGTAATVPRLDARYDWLGWSFDPSSALHNASLSLAWLGDGCVGDAAHVPNLGGAVALVSNATSFAQAPCSYFAMVRTAMRANASALIVYSDEGTPAIDMNCEGATQCDDRHVGLPATMVGHEAGLRLRDAAAAPSGGATVRFVTRVTRGTNFGLNAHGALVQTWGGAGAGAGAVDGNPGDGSCLLYPRMSFLAWAGRHALFQKGLDAKIAARPARAVTIPIFTNESLRPSGGNCCAPRARRPRLSQP